MEFIDYSSRRGVLAQILPKVHEVYAANARDDKSAFLPPPEHIISWTQTMRRVVLDVNRRFLVAMDGERLAGFLFYRVASVGQEKEVYIEDLQLAPLYRGKSGIVEGLTRKMEFDAAVKDSTVYAGERVRRDADEEMLAAKGATERTSGYEKLGSFSKAAGHLKIRYTRVF
jgi:hypothetical protein